MNNKPAKRTQVDGLQDFYSDLAGLDCSVPGNIDRTRQEFKDEADINKLLYRYGVGLIAPTPPSGNGNTIDYDLDLLQAMEAIQQAKTTWANLPQAIKNDYPSWQQFLNAIDRGEIRITDTPPAPTPEPTPEPIP